MSAGRSASLSGRVLKLVLSVAVLAAIALAVFHLQQPTLTLAITDGVEGVALKKIAREFSAQNHVWIQVKEFSYDQLYDTELEAAGSDSSMYDVILADDPWLPALMAPREAAPAHSPAFAQEGLQELTFTPEECIRLKLEDFAETCLGVCRKSYVKRAGSCSDVLYALPFVGNSQLFCFRRSASLVSAPATWKDVIEKSEPQPQQNGMGGYVMRVGRGNSIVTDFMPILWEASPESSSTTDLVPLRPESLEAFRYLAKLRENGRANRSIVSKDDFDLAVHLARNGASMSIVWSAWAMAITKVSVFAAANASINDLVFDKVPGPHPALGSWLLAIPARAKHKQLAKRFLLFATDQKQTASAALEGNPPPRKSILECKNYKDLALGSAEECTQRFPTFAKQLESLESAQPRPRTPHWKEYETILGDILSEVYAGTLPPEDALMLANRAIQSVSGRKQEPVAESLPTK